MKNTKTKKTQFSYDFLWLPVISYGFPMISYDFPIVSKQLEAKALICFSTLRSSAKPLEAFRNEVTIENLQNDENSSFDDLA